MLLQICIKFAYNCICMKIKIGMLFIRIERLFNRNSENGKCNVCIIYIDILYKIKRSERRRLSTTGGIIKRKI